MEGGNRQKLHSQIKHANKKWNDAFSNKTVCNITWKNWYSRKTFSNVKQKKQPSNKTTCVKWNNEMSDKMLHCQMKQRVLKWTKLVL